MERMMDEEEIKKAIRNYACNKFGIVGIPYIDLFVDMYPSSSPHSSPQISFKALVRTDK